MKVFRSYFNKINNTKIKLPFPIIDIYIFKWNKISQTGIHDHADKGCILWLIKGEIEEKIFNKHYKYLYTNIHSSPSISYIHNNIGYHSIKPIKKSISIHFYYTKYHKTKYFK